MIMSSRSMVSSIDAIPCSTRTAAHSRTSFMDSQVGIQLSAVPSERNITTRRFGDSLLKLRNSAPKMLIVGGSILGEGIKAFGAHPAFELIGTDVALVSPPMLPFMDSISSDKRQGVVFVTAS